MSLIKSLKISWLSPQRVKQLSFGNVTSHKTVNVRTFKPEPGGLFDPCIFGPFLNYECYCGKYKGKENKGQKCERCGVLIAEKNLQRWRMGHISLSAPVTNIALFKILATNLSKLLGIPSKKLEDIIYLRAYVVIDNGSTNLLKKGEVLEKKLDLRLINSILQEVIQNRFLPIKEKLNKLINQIRHEINQLESSENAEKIITTFEKKLEEIKKDEKSNLEVISQAEELGQNLVGEKEENKNYYKILELKKDATQEEIKKAYRKMALK